MLVCKNTFKNTVYSVLEGLQVSVKQVKKVFTMQLQLKTFHQEQSIYMTIHLLTTITR